MTEIHVIFPDAPTDVLVFLVDRQAWFTADEIAQEVAPVDADDPLATTRRALATLTTAGYVKSGAGRYWATPAGSAAVREARAKAAGE